MPAIKNWYSDPPDAVKVTLSFKQIVSFASELTREIVGIGMTVKVYAELPGFEQPLEVPITATESPLLKIEVEKVAAPLGLP